MDGDGDDVAAGPRATCTPSEPPARGASDEARATRRARQQARRARRARGRVTPRRARYRGGRTGRTGHRRCVFGRRGRLTRPLARACTCSARPPEPRLQSRDRSERVEWRMGSLGSVPSEDGRNPSPTPARSCTVLSLSRPAPTCVERTRPASCSASAASQKGQRAFPCDDGMDGLSARVARGTKTINAGSGTTPPAPHLCRLLLRPVTPSRAVSPCHGASPPPPATTQRRVVRPAGPNKERPKQHSRTPSS